MLHRSSVWTPVKWQGGGFGRVGRIKVVHELACRMMEGVVDLLVNLIDERGPRQRLRRGKEVQDICGDESYRRSYVAGEVWIRVLCKLRERKVSTVGRQRL